MKKIFIICMILGCASMAKAQRYQLKLNDSLKAIPLPVIPEIKSGPLTSYLSPLNKLTPNPLTVTFSQVDKMPVMALPNTDRMPVAKLESRSIDKMPILKLQPMEEPLKQTP